jgi:hypothetical protein
VPLLSDPVSVLASVYPPAKSIAAEPSPTLRV